MSDFSIPIQVLYAGLAGVLIALLVATATNKWSCKVFFLLALRLAIGWHFLFEGLHKVHDTYAGPSDAVPRPFSSKPYFELAEGPLGPVMRARIGSDTDAAIEAKLKPQNLPQGLADLSPNDRTPHPLTAPFGLRADGTPVPTFEAYQKEKPGATAEQYEKARLEGHIADYEAFAQMAPPAVKEEWDAFVKAFIEQYQLDDATTAKLDGTLSGPEKQELLSGKGSGDLTVLALAQYGMWVAGVEPVGTEVKFVSGDTPLTAPQRLDYIAIREKEYEQLKDRGRVELGTGYGYEQKRLQDARSGIRAAKAALVSDAAALLKSLKENTFKAVMSARTGGGTLPSATFAAPAKFEAILPPAGAPENASFDAVPADLRGMWDGYRDAVKGAYPDLEGSETKVGEQIDRTYENLKARFASWYFGRDPFSNRPVPGFEAEAGAYRDAVKRAAELKQQASQADGPLNRLVSQRLADEAAQDVTDARQAALAELDTQYAELRSGLTSKDAIPADVTAGPVSVATDNSEIEKIDWWTRWAITAIGAMLLAGLFTRIACLAGGVFLVMTYLTHPPFPWLPNPPGTEGNPLFINKNVIEFLGLMVILVHPTGRWLGLDALIHWVVIGRKAAKRGEVA